MIREDLAHAGRIARELVEERERQVDVEGYSTDHDDRHHTGDLAGVAGFYAHSAWKTAYAGADPDREPPLGWPWDDQWWKPSTARRDLVKAGALILAEIARIDRAEGRLPAPPAHGPLLADVRRGDRLVADGRFTCIDRGAVVEVDQMQDGALCVACRDGFHRLSAQVDAHGRLTGLTRAPDQEASE
ncbi:MAG: hypothetical protein AB7O45_10210 [Alphaproteobacteria bacterium]